MRYQSSGQRLDRIVILSNKLRSMVSKEEYDQLVQWLHFRMTPYEAILFLEKEIKDREGREQL